MFDLGNGVYGFFYVHHIDSVELKALQNLANLLSLGYYHKPVVTGTKKRSINKVTDGMKKEILRLHGAGLTYREIAENLSINRETAGVYVREHKRKLGLKISRNGK